MFQPYSNLGSSNVVTYNPAWEQNVTEEDWQGPAQMCALCDTKEQSSSCLSLEVKQYATGNVSHKPNTASFVLKGLYCS